MSRIKRKQQHTLPNRQLARIFQFSAQDLASNRAGFMSRAQEWELALWLRRLFGWVDDLLPLRWLTPTRRKRVEHLCGKIRLEYVQHQIQAPFHSDIHESHYLYIGANRFSVTAQQYHSVAENVVFHVYCSSQTRKILSLERAIHGCGEEVT